MASTRSARTHLLLFFLILGTFVGCSGGGSQPGAAVPVVPNVVNNEFVLEPNVRLLPADTVVASFEADRLVLEGVSNVQVGDILFKSEGDIRFAVRVVSVTVVGGQTIIETAPVSLPDIFLSANIQRTDVLAPETIVANFQPLTPGVTVEILGAEPARQARHGGPECDHATNPGSIGHAHVPLNLPVQGSDGLSANVKGCLTIDFGVESDYQQQPLNPVPKRALVAPFVSVNGTVDVTGEANGKFYHVVPLFKLPPTFVTSLGPAWLDIEPTVELILDGDVDFEGNLNCKTEVVLKTGVDYRDGRFNPVFPDKPSLDFNADLRGSARVKLSPLAVKVKALFQPNLGEIFIQGDFLAAEANCQLSTEPFGTNVFVDLVGSVTLGGRALWQKFPSFTQELYRFPLAARFNPSPVKVSYPVVYMGDGGAFPNHQGQQYVSNDGELTLKVGEKVPLRSEGVLVLPSGLARFITNSDGSATNLTRECLWTSSASGVATVQSDGVVVGRAPGQARLTVRHPSSNRSAFVQITVTDARMDGIQLVSAGQDTQARNRLVNTVEQFKSVILDAKGLFSDGTRPVLGALDVQWSVQPAGLAILEQNGRLTGVEPGVVTVTATDRSTGQSASLDVEVVPPPVLDFTIDPLARSILRGESFRFAAAGHVGSILTSNLNSRLLWTSVTPGIVSVTADGVVTGVGVGTGTIEVANPDQPDEPPKRVIVVVGRPLANLLTIDTTTNRLGETVPPGPLFVGQQGRFDATARLNDGAVEKLGQECRWLSTNPRVLQVAPNGDFQVVGPGYATVLAAVDKVGHSLEFRAIGVPQRLTFEGEPLSGPVTQDLADPTTKIRVVIADAMLQRVPDATGLIALALEQPAPGQLTGNVTMMAQQGVADFTGLFVSAAGTYRLIATLGNLFGRSEEFTASGGPLVLSFQDPPTDTVAGQTMVTVTVLVRDAQNNVPAGVDTLQSSVRIGQNPAGGTLTGVLSPTPTAGGTVAFSSLSIDQPGNGYTLIFSVGGVELESTPFNIVANAGFLFVASQTDNGLRSASVANDGSLGFNGPLELTNVLPSDLVHIGNTLYAAVAGPAAARFSKVTRFDIDPTTGILTNQGSTSPGIDHFNGPIELASNGASSLFLVTGGAPALTAMTLDPATGAITNNVTQTPGASNLMAGVDARQAAFGARDLAFVGEIGAGGSNDVWMFQLDRSVTPPLLSSGVLTTTPAVNGRCEALKLIGNRLYMASSVSGPGPATILRWDVDSLTGALTNQTTAHSYAGIGVPKSMHVVSHPVLGQLMFVTHRATTGISTFQVEANGDLTLLSETASAPNPSRMADALLPGGRRVLYVSADTGVQAFDIDQTTGALSPVTNSPFTAFSGPWGLAR